MPATIATLNAADLADMKFTPETGRDGWYACGNLRVVLRGEDGTEVFAFTDSRRHILAWSAQFNGATPAAVIKAAIAAAPKSPFTAIEVAYRIRGSGKGWTTKVCKTERALQGLLETLAEQGAETRTRDAY